MKIKLSLLMLLLTAFSYAQTTDSTSPTFVQNMEITMGKLKTLEKNITICLFRRNCTPYSGAN